MDDVRSITTSYTQPEWLEWIVPNGYPNDLHSSIAEDKGPPFLLSRKPLH